MRQPVDLAVERRVLLRRVEHRRNEELRFDLARVHRLVDAELLLRASDPVLRRLGKVEACPTSRAQLGDHLLVVRERELDLDTGLLLELRDDVGWHVIGPGNDAQLVVLCVRGCGAECDETGDEGDAERLHGNLQCGRVFRLLQRGAGADKLTVTFATARFVSQSARMTGNNQGRVLLRHGFGE